VGRAATKIFYATILKEFYEGVSPLSGNKMFAKEGSAGSKKCRQLRHTK
jgi:hypothetical protein